MSTKTEICNLATSHLGIGKEIQNFDTDKSQEAMTCRRYYDISRKATLRDFEWPFATKTIALGLVTKNPTSEWKFSYQYPSDCLHFRRILSLRRNDTNQSRVPYRLVQGLSSQEIYSDWCGAQGEYTVDVTDTSRFPEDFVMALSYRIAAYGAARLTAGDPFKLADSAMKNYEMEIGKAKATAANEEQEENAPESEFIRGRD